MACDYFPGYGANVLLEIGKRWVKQGHDVRVLCSRFTQNGDSINAGFVDGIECRRVGGIQFFAFGSPFFILTNPFGLLRYIRNVNPDVINCHFHTSFISTFIVVAKRLCMVSQPVTFSFHGFEGRYANNVKLLYRSYWRAFEGLFAELEGLTNINKEHERLGFEFSKRIRYTPNAASVMKSQLTCDSSWRGLDVNPDDTVVLFVGQLRSSKGLPVLIEAARLGLKNHPNVKFVIVGSGPLESELKHMVEELGLCNHVILTGHVGEDDLSHLREIADIFVLSSYVEGVPLVMLDAMASGLPVVSTNVGSISDYVENGKHGFLVEPGNPRALAESLSILASDKELRERMGAACRNRVANLNWDDISRDYIVEFKKAITAGNVRSCSGHKLA